MDIETPTLRWLAMTGGKVPTDRLQQIRQAKAEVHLFVTYGQTECAPRITSIGPDKIDKKPESVGSPPSEIQVLVVDENGNPVEQGEIGEVLVKGANVMVGYWNDPKGTDAVIDQQGRLHTGDLGWFDMDGDLFLAGRKQAMIKSAGERIFPEEIELILERHGHITEAVVIGVPDPMYGQRIEAHLLLSKVDENTDGNSILDDIRDYCLGKMPFARAPKAYHIWDKLPRKPNGKLDQQRLLNKSESEFK